MDDLIKMMAIEKLCSILECKGDNSFKHLVKHNSGCDFSEQINEIQRELKIIKENSSKKTSEHDSSELDLIVSGLISKNPIVERVNKLYEQIDSNDKCIENYTQDVNTKVTGLNKRVSNVNEQVTNLNTKVSDIEKNVSEFINEFNSIVDAQSDDICEFMTRLNLQKETLDHLSSLKNSSIDSNTINEKIDNSSKYMYKLKMDFEEYIKHNDQQIFPLFDEKIKDCVSINMFEECSKKTEDNITIINKMIDDMKNDYFQFEKGINNLIENNKNQNELISEHILSECERKFTTKDNIDTVMNSFVFLEQRLNIIVLRLNEIDMRMNEIDRKQIERIDALEEKYNKLETLFLRSQEKNLKPVKDAEVTCNINVKCDDEEHEEHDEVRELIEHLPLINGDNDVDERLSLNNVEKDVIDETVDESDEVDEVETEEVEEEQSEEEVGTEDEIETDTEETKKQVVQEVVVVDDEIDESSGDEVFEIEIDDVTYFATDEDNGVLYEMTSDGDVGKKVGIIKNGEPIFN
jgi:tetrahydromethanopterin S-methyltransferase subunit B